ncbi:hypothetical protein BSAF29S_05758 [Bacillus safensis subsp. safensis]
MKPNETPSHTLQGYPAQSNEQSVYTKKIKKTGCGCGNKKETSIEEKNKSRIYPVFLLPFF